MIHQMSTTTTVRDEYVLTCTCGIQFIGDKDGIIRNMVFHQEEAAAERKAERSKDKV